MIVDGELLDLKTTALSSPLSREYLWQMLGYVMADTDDEHGIEQGRLHLAALALPEPLAGR